MRLKAPHAIRLPAHATVATDAPTLTPPACWPVVVSQMRTVWSPLAVVMRVPSGENAQAFTPLVWPVSCWSCWPVVVSQMRTVWSQLAVAMRVPSGENPHADTRWCGR